MGGLFGDGFRVQGRIFGSGVRSRFENGFSDGFGDGFGGVGDSETTVVQNVLGPGFGDGLRSGLEADCGLEIREWNRCVSW